MLKTTKYFLEDFNIKDVKPIKGNIIILIESSSKKGLIPSITYIATVKECFIDIDILEFLQKKLSELGHHNIVSLSTIEFSDELELCKEFLNLVKLYDPRLTGKKTVDNRINELHKNQSYSNDKFWELNNYLISLKINNNKSDSYPIATSLIKKIPNTKGIYFIYDIDSNLMYVGKSVHMQNRISYHASKNSVEYDWKHNFYSAKFIEFPKATDRELDDYETYFINKEKPKLNISKVYTYKSERYSPKYNKSISKFNDLEHYLRYLYSIEILNELFNLDKLIEEKQKELDDLKELLV